MTQQTLPAPAGPDRPPLTADFVGAGDAIHAKHRVQRRDLCSACVFMLHVSRASWAPMPAVWVRKRAGAANNLPSIAFYALLCSQHHTEWKERDDAAKAEAKAREAQR